MSSVWATGSAGPLDARGGLEQLVDSVGLLDALLLEALAHVPVAMAILAMAILTTGLQARGPAPLVSSLWATGSADPLDARGGLEQLVDGVGLLDALLLEALAHVPVAMAILAMAILTTDLQARGPALRAARRPRATRRQSAAPAGSAASAGWRRRPAPCPPRPTTPQSRARPASGTLRGTRRRLARRLARRLPAGLGRRACGQRLRGPAAAG